MGRGKVGLVQALLVCDTQQELFIVLLLLLYRPVYAILLLSV